MKQILTAFILVSLSVLTACGGGGGGTKAPSADSSPTLTGVFIDAPTKGLTYKATPSATTGTTDAEGKFNFKAGDTVSFSITTSGGEITLGSALVSIPSNSNAVVSVLSLPNGVQAAQILQTLNQGSATNIDVGNLSLSSADVAKLNSYMTNPTAVAPSVSIAGINKQLIDTNQAATAAITSLSTPTTVQSISATSINNSLIGKVFYSQGVTKLASGEASSVVGLGYLNSTGIVTEVWNDGTIDSNASWSSVDNGFVMTSKGLNATATINYVDSTLMALSYSAFDSKKINSVGYFVKPVSYADWAGKVFAITGNTNSYCSPQPTYLSVSADGSQANLLCQLGGAVYGSSSLSQYAPLPGVWIVQETLNGKTSTFFIGLLAGGTLASGKMFLYMPSTATTPFRSGILSIKLAQ